ncbi:Hypothetical protein CINCED_3A016594 [Cinara cedri]|uniref:Uncharacterized protein n=1 Tax=Cinara cedri TaxID=506608 RepID=A0A5E4M9X1_9HEMI|nr:Hypothetical protein CINCED_3A016594 [Cinara cedri]
MSTNKAGYTKSKTVQKINQPSNQLFDELIPSNTVLQPKSKTKRAVSSTPTTPTTPTSHQAVIKKTTKIELPPPIYFKGVKNYSDLRQTISDQIEPGRYICKSNVTHIKIQTNTPDNY